ncbi:putative Paraflagellar rod protein [Trypanosoma vivax]|nr:putative Paraflagellar rod protein [Trypanosoma vivax]
MFGPTEDALNQAGIEFVHPAEEVEDGNMNRRSKMVEYRAHLAKQEEVKIAPSARSSSAPRCYRANSTAAARCSRSRSSNTLACFCISPKTNVQP